MGPQSQVQPEEIKTKYVKNGYVSIDGEIVLDETPTTRTIFRRALTPPNGVRGELVRQKIDENGVFQELNEVNFTVAPKNSGIRIQIPSAGLKTLAHDLYILFSNRKDLSPGFGEHQYIVGDKSRTIVLGDDNIADIVKQIIDKGYERVVWEELAEKKPGLLEKLMIARSQIERTAVIDEFQESLITEAGNESYWHNLIDKNPWIIQMVFSSPIVYINGEVYLGGKKAIGRNGKEGVATDFLCADETSKSFAVVDIKTPGTQLVGSRYRGEGSAELYSASQDFSGSIVQVRHQVKTAVEYFESVLGKTYTDINHVHPHSVIIIGKTSSLTIEQLKSFNYLRHSLHGTTVITFDELLRRLRVVYGRRQQPVSQI